MPRRRATPQQHPTRSSGRQRYIVVEHLDNGGTKIVGRYDNGVVARGVADAYRKMLPRGSSRWYTVKRNTR